MGEFPVAERAFELAELMALELGIDAEKDWSGWTIEVRGPEGRKLFAAPNGRLKSRSFQRTRAALLQSQACANCGSTSRSPGMRLTGGGRFGSDLRIKMC
jgi:hypothetical protein